MAEEIAIEASAKIISLASKYIIFSVVAIALGSVSLVYGVLIYLVFPSEGIVYAVFVGFFLGVAFTAIGVFLVFWGLYWMRAEGKRLRARYSTPSHATEAK